MQAKQPEMVTREHFAHVMRRILKHRGLPFTLVHQNYEAGVDTGPHRHEDFYALYVVESGSGVHVINGHPYPVTRGDVYMTPPGSTHAYRDYRLLRAESLCFTADLFSEAQMEALRSLRGFWQLFIAPPPEPEFRDYHLHLPPERHEAVHRMIEEIGTELEGVAPLAPELVSGLFFRLLVYLARWQAEWEKERRQRNQRGGGAHSRGLAEVLQVCEQRFAEPLTVPQLAALMFLSPSHFSEVFAREVGMTPAAYLRRLRLERAQKLLRSTDTSATEIALQVGFGDLAQLSRAFRAAFGISPRTYRSQFSKSK